MTLKISNHAYNFQALAELAKTPKNLKRETVVTSDAFASLKEADALHTGRIFHGCKWIKSIAVGALTTASIAGVIGGTCYAAYLKSDEIGSFIQSHSDGFSNSSLIAAGACGGQLFTQDGRDMLKFTGKVTIVGIALAGVKAGQRTLSNGDAEAERREASVKNKYAAATHDMHRVYKGMTEYAKTLHSRAHSEQAKKILDVFPKVLKEYESLGLTPEDARTMTSDFRGALEILADRV